MTTYYKNVFLCHIGDAGLSGIKHTLDAALRRIYSGIKLGLLQKGEKISPQWAHVSHSNDIPAVTFSSLEFLNNQTSIPTSILCDLAPLWLVQLHDPVTLLFPIYCFAPLMMASFLYLTLDSRLTSTQAYSIHAFPALSHLEEGKGHELRHSGKSLYLLFAWNNFLLCPQPYASWCCLCFQERNIHQLIKPILF